MEKDIKSNNGWCFALINGRLTEIYFDEKVGPYAHCYIERNEYNKREQKMIDADIKKYQFSYRKGYYFDKLKNIKFKIKNPFTDRIKESLKEDKISKESRKKVERILKSC